MSCAESFGQILVWASKCVEANTERCDARFLESLWLEHCELLKGKQSHQSGDVPVADGNDLLGLAESDNGRADPGPHLILRRLDASLERLISRALQVMEVLIAQTARENFL